MLFSQLLLLCFVITSCASSYTPKTRIPAQEASSEKEKNNDIGKTLKEIYVKGSIDGKSLFMVYGFEDAVKDMKHIMKNAIKMKQLKAIGNSVYDKEHDEDYVHAVKEGVEFSKETAERYDEDVKDIIKWPWKSLKRMKKSYQVSFDNARDAYYHSSNPVGGSVKYAGHAIWANVKGAYYLVVEVPVVTAAAIGAITLEGASIALAVPTAVILQTLKLAWQSFAFVIRTAIVVPFKTTIAAAEGLYATLSTTTAASVTLVAAGGLAVFKGTKWLVYTMPHRLFNPISVQGNTDATVDEQQDFADKVVKNLEETILEDSLRLTSKEIKEYTSKFTLSTEAIKNAVTVKLGIDHQKVKVTVTASKTFIKSFKDDNTSRREAREKVEKMLQDLVDKLIAIR